MLLLPLIVSVNTAHKCVCCHSQLTNQRYSCENIKYYRLGSVRTARHFKSYTVNDIYDICTCTKAEKVPHGEELQCWPELQFCQLSQGWNMALEVDMPRQAMQLQGTSPHASSLFCHDAQAATSTSDCTAGTNYNHNPSPRDHLEQGCNWNMLLLSSHPHAHISFSRTQESKNKKSMPPKHHFNKAHLVKFIFCDSLCCQRRSLKGRTYTQRYEQRGENCPNMNDERKMGRTALNNPWRGVTAQRYYFAACVAVETQ